MSMMGKGAMIASAVAVMFGVIGCGSDSAEDKTTTAQGVKCDGVNECKGQSECKSANGGNECQGLNDCKGQGWATVATAEECTTKGGKVIG